MLKVRVMPTLLYKDYGLVKGIGFDSWRRTGSAMQQIKVYNMREVDELIFVDISANADGRAPDFELIDDLADDCFMPMTVGGGIRTLDQARRVLQVGADKVAINTGAIENPRLISEIAEQFGSQCVVVSIDYRLRDDGRREIFTYSGRRATGLDPVQFAVEAERLGAGEILFTSIERDGAFVGYDLQGIRALTSTISIPVIASGGAGNYQHVVDAVVHAGASAVAAASIFHFTEQTPAGAKQALHAAGVPVRQNFVAA